MTPTVTVTEHRAAPRHRVYKGGRINFERAPGIDCVIRNISDGGACLEVETAFPIPDQFRLMIKPEQTIRGCRIAWRRGHKIGVRFVQQSRPSPAL